MEGFTAKLEVLYRQGICMLMVFGVFASTLACSNAPAPDYVTWEGSKGAGFVHIVGDLQRTSLPELIIGREDNDSPRAALIASIVSERPRALFLLGDLVFDGSNPDDWRAFDLLLKPVRDMSIPTIPALGNHDYYGLDRNALRELRARFPNLKRETWGTFEDEAMVWILLDSNRDAFDDLSWSRQRRWFQAQLDRAEVSEAVQGIIVLLHHPPYTNSALTGDEVEVQTAFLPSFMSSSKTLAMISGHAHTYERFLRGGKMFVVSGGGGGPRVDLLKGSERRHEDDLVSMPAPRPMHYLKAVTMKDGVMVTAKGVDGERFDQFMLRW